jgi:hypothetical protein
MNTLRIRMVCCLLALTAGLGWAPAVSAQQCDDTTRQNFATDVANGFTASQLETKYGFCRTASTSSESECAEETTGAITGYGNVVQAVKVGLNSNTSWERMNGCGYHPQAELASCDVEIRLTGGYGAFPGGTFEHVRFCFDCDKNGTWDYQTLGFVHVTNNNFAVNPNPTPSWYHEAHASTFAAPVACTTNNGGEGTMRTILSWAALPPPCANGTSLVTAPLQPMPIFGNAFDETIRRDP